MKGSRVALGGAALPSSVVGLAVGLLFTAWRFPVLWQPPVWDGAMGVSPAAITLEGLDFDVRALTRMDDYRLGGPNVHSLSVYTWFVAVMIRVCGSYLSALPWLHLASFAVLGVLAAGVHRVARFAGASPGGALLATLLAVLFPPVVVQASDVYLDLPLAAATVWAFAFALEDRWWAALTAASVAGAIKPSALILVPVLAWLAIDERPVRWRRLGALTIPAAVAVAPLFMNSAIRASSSGTDSTVVTTTVVTLVYLSRMPMLLLLILAVAVLHLSGRGRNRAVASRRLAASALLLVASFLLFFFLNPLASKGVPALPRYTTLFSPLLAAALVVTAEWRLPGGYRSVPAVVALILFLANMRGHIEPPSTNWYPFAERSLAYEKMLAVQRASLSRFQKLGRVMPAYYDHFTHYRLSYPETGWSDGPLPDGTPVRITPGRRWDDLANMPAEFVMLLEAEGLGGDEVADIRRRAAASEEWTVETEVFEEGEFRNEVITVRRRSASTTGELGQTMPVRSVPARIDP